MGIGSDFSEGADRAGWDQEFGADGKYPNITGSLGEWYGYDTRFAKGGSSASDFPEIIDAISAGSIAFTIDQQQYLQGYLPILLLYLYVTNLNTAGGGLPILTGPGFVDQSNADQVAALVTAGTR